MKQLLSIFFILTLGLPLWAQQQGGGKFNPENMPKDGILTGKVIDASTNHPIPYANIGLYSMRDSSVISGAITNDKGFFKMTDIRYGRHYAIVNFMGYNKKIINDIRIHPQNKEASIGTVSLDVASENIEEVEIIADRTTIAFKIDKKVVNVGQDLQTSGGTAVDVLETVPSVQVDIDGNVSLRGSSSFTVLIDGKPSILTGSDALQQIPTSAIENIEIITNPSAKYDPDGMAGIINIVMKKQKRGGFNGIINTSVSSGDKYSANATFNYKTEKLNLFAGADYSDNTHYGTSKTVQEIYGTDYNTTILSDGERNHIRDGYGLKLGADIYLNPNNTLSLSGNYRNREFGRDSYNNYNVFNSIDFMNIYTQNISDFRVTGNSVDLRADYELKFAQPEHKLNASAYYSAWEGSDFENQSTDTTNAQWTSLNKLMAKHQTNEQNNRMNWRAQLDYIRPIGQGKLELGAQARHDYELSDFVYEDLNPLNNTWINNPTFTNKSNYVRDIYSGYALWSSMIGTFGYKIGLRAEYTNRLIDQQTTNEQYALDTINLFPSVHLSKKLWAQQELQLSYSRRIERPGRWYLNPFPNYSDGYTIRIGNPAVQPEYVDSYELSYQKRIKQSFVAVELYHRQTSGKIERVTYVNDDNMIVRTVDNLTRDYSTGVELTANVALTKTWQMNLTGDFYQYKIDGEILDEQVTQTTETWGGRFNTSYRLPKIDTRFQFSAFYRAPSITSQGSRDAFFFTNFAVRQDFFKRSLSLTFNVRDIFGTMKHSFESNSDNLYTSMEFSRESPVFGLSLSYKINNYQQDRKRGSNGGGGEMIDDDF